MPRFPLAVSLLSLAVLLAPQSAGAHTFSGTCHGFMGVGRWEPAIGLVPGHHVLRARFAGGRCSGILDGKRVAGVELRAATRLEGLQGCTLGILEGEVFFTIGGRRFRGASTYRRVGTLVTILMAARGGGRGVVVVRARTGPIAEDSELGRNPLLAPLAEPVPLPDAFAACAANDLAQMPLEGVLFRTLDPISSG